MFYRILSAPPGYLPHEKYMVAEYTTVEFGSRSRNLTNAVGSKFFATLEEAQRAIPCDATQLPYQPEDQFLELWMSSESGG